MKKVLITGKNGYISTNITKYLQSLGYQVTIVNLLCKDWKNRYSFRYYDVLIHTAGLVHKKEKNISLEEFYNVNSYLTYDVALKAKEEGVKQFIFFSSESVYGMSPSVYKKVIINRHSKTNPKTKYGKSKLKGEELLNTINDANFKVLILRPPMVYGEGCPGNYGALKNFVLKYKVFPKIKTEKSLLSINKLCEYVHLYIENNSSGIELPQDDELHRMDYFAKEIAGENNTRVFLSITLLIAIKLLGFMPIIKKAFGYLIISK